MNKKKNEPNYKKILFQLCAGLTFSDHLEDVGDDVVKALELANEDPYKFLETCDGEWQRTIAAWAADQGVTTLYGTKLDHCTKCGHSMSTDEIELGLSQCCGDDE